MFRTLISLTLAACLTAPVAAQEEFETLKVTGRLSAELDELNEGTGTMSGGQKHRIRASALIAGLQLWNPEDLETFRLGEVGLAPPTIPAGVAENAKLFVCTELRVINGHFTYFGSEPIEGEVNPNKQYLIADFETEHQNSAPQLNQYTEDFLLGRAYVATDCLQRRSLYYMPIYLREDVGSVSELLMTVEAVGATVTAKLNPQGISEKEEPFNCIPTRRIQSGYDCSIALKDIHNLPENASGLYDISVVISRQGQEDQVFYARASIPPLPN